MRISPDLDVLGGLLAPARPRAHIKALSPRARAETARVAALMALRAWGHLRCSEVARLVFPEARYREQMAQRLMRRLERITGEVARRLNSTGTQSYVLTRSGAATLEAMGHDAHHGLELSSVAGATFLHRCLGTSFGIEKALAGHEVYGEHSIAQGFAPATREALAAHYRKIPDLLYVRKGVAHWGEVEASAKPTTHLEACIRIARHVGQPLLPGSPILLGGLTFVFDASQGHAGRIARVAASAWSDLAERERAELRRRVTLAHLDLGPLLRWNGMRESGL